MPVNRRQVVIGVIVLGGGLAGYEVYKYQKNKKAAQQAAATSATAASGYGSGMSGPYGYGASGYGYGAGTTYGYGASGGFPAGYYGYGVVSPPGNVVTSTPATTNAQWAQAAITQLQQDGFDSMSVASALGAYDNGREVNAGQVNIIDAAIGVEGYPPVPGKDGYPPAIKTGGTTGGGQGQKVSVPNVKGKKGEQANDEITGAGLKAAQIPAKTPQGKSTTVTSQSPAAGRLVNKGSTVTYHVRVV